MKIIISKSKWLEVGFKSGWTKTAKAVDIEYSPSFTSLEKKKVTLEISPGEIQEGETLKDVAQRKLNKREKSQVTITKFVPRSIVRKKASLRKKILKEIGLKEKK